MFASLFFLFIKVYLLNIYFIAVHTFIALFFKNLM